MGDAPRRNNTCLFRELDDRMSPTDPIAAPISHDSDTMVSVGSSEVAVIVVNYRTPQFVMQSVESLLPELREVNGVVRIIDNRSDDASPSIIRQWISKNGFKEQVSMTLAARNGGFAAGNNIGIRSVRARYYLLLNSDTYMRPGAITSLVSFAEQHPGIGLIGASLEGPSGTPQQSEFRYPSPFRELDRAAATGPITRWLRRWNARPSARRNTYPGRPDWVSFAAVLIRREVLEDIGYLDEGYFMYFEDVDYCLRARKAGWGIATSPSSHVVHLEGGTSDVKRRATARERLPRYYYSARSRYYRKHHGLVGLVTANMFWYAGRLVSLAREHIGRRSTHISKRQWLDIWTDWHKAIERKRGAW